MGMYTDILHISQSKLTLNQSYHWRGIKIRAVFIYFLNRFVERERKLQARRSGQIQEETGDSNSAFLMNAAQLLRLERQCSSHRYIIKRNPLNFKSIQWNHLQAFPISWDYPFKAYIFHGTVIFLTEIMVSVNRLKA
jgi:hypothetical protein